MAYSFGNLVQPLLCTQQLQVSLTSDEDDHDDKYIFLPRHSICIEHVNINTLSTKS